MNEKNLFVLHILEDQIFLLNTIKCYLCANKPMTMSDFLAKNNDIFLNAQEIIDAKNILKRGLLQTSTGNKQFIAALIRGISVCIALLTEVYGSGPRCSNCHTVDEFDVIIGQECKFKWTRSSCKVLVDDIGKAFSFLAVYGTLPSLPHGTWSFQTKCHLCKSRKYQAEINEILCSGRQGTSEFCSHLIRFKSQTLDKWEDKFEIDVRSMGEESTTQSRQEVLFPSLTWENTSVDICSQTNALGMKMQLARKQEQLNDIRKDVRCIYSDYIQAKNKEMQLNEPKCLSSICYSLVGQLVKHLTGRLSSIAKFSPMFNHNIVAEKRTDSSDRLKECLEGVVVQKINNKIIQQEYEKLLVDPLSLTSGHSHMLRCSIIVKQFMLTFGVSAKELCNMSNVWNHLSTKVVLQKQMQTSEERLLYAVYILEVFSYWLSLIHVNGHFRLKMLRGDLEEQTDKSGIVFLYDFEQVGLRLPNGSLFQSTYTDVLDLCTEYLFYLYQTGVCRHEPAVCQILSIQ